MYLPRVDEAVPEEPAMKMEPTAGGTETILLVEDVDSLRELARDILEGQGHTVIEACSGSAALQELERRAGPVDLLLTDLVMPAMSGRELADQITGRNPGTKVLYMSGYTDDSLERHGALESGMAFGEKPFTIDGLLRKVREVLDS